MTVTPDDKKLGLYCATVKYAGHLSGQWLVKQARLCPNKKSGIMASYPPVWLQGIWLPLHGYDYSNTPLWAGIFLLPLTAGILIAGPTSGLLSDRFGARGIATAAALAALAALASLLRGPHGASPADPAAAARQPAGSRDEISA
jgi:hypothetical protein